MSSLPVTAGGHRYGQIIHQGFVNKKSKGKVWMRRYMVLWEDKALRFYGTETRGNVIGKIKTKYVDAIQKLSKEDCDKLDSVTPYFFTISSSSMRKMWQFGCDDEEQLTKWICILRSLRKIQKYHEKNSDKITIERVNLMKKIKNVDNVSLIFGYIRIEAYNKYNINIPASIIEYIVLYRWHTLENEHIALESRLEMKTEDTEWVTKYCRVSD